MHELFAEPQHPYTLGLLGRRPARRRVRRVADRGCRRSPAGSRRCASCPTGCAFAPRCARADGMRCIRAARAPRRPARPRGRVLRIPGRQRERSARTRGASTSSSTIRAEGPRRRDRARGRRGLVHARPRRAARARRRVGKRQVDGREVRPAAARADRRDDPAQRHRHHAPLAASDAAATGRSSTSCSRIPQSSLNPRMTCGDIVAEPLRRHRLADRRDRRRPRRRDLRRRRASLGAPLPLPARALGRAAPAGRAGARADRRAERSRGRRAGVGARRLGAGVDPEPARRPPARARVLVPLHRARPRNRRVPVRPDRGDACGEARRAGLAGRAVLVASASLHPGAPLGGGRARPGRAAQTPARRAGGRAAEPARATVGLPLPDPLPARAAVGAALDRGGAAPARSTSRGISSPATSLGRAPPLRD